MQSRPGQQMSREQKLQWYATQLMEDAATAEKSGNQETAIKAYLNASDILLLLSKKETNYVAWKSLADRAEHCHKKARMLIAQRPDQSGQSGLV
ncbi:MAG TPA: hypothetical protein VEJ36_01155 [Nitrososphaerales archaeon]|nr:hypothetical protein [Nitrososphaerales archaeon]